MRANEFTRHSVLKVITIGWSHFQSASNKPLKFVCFTREPTSSPVLTKWWNKELMLATYAQRLPILVANILAPKFGFGPDWLLRCVPAGVDFTGLTHCGPVTHIWWYWSVSTLVQVKAWCHQAPSHYLNQCWPRYLHDGVLWHSLATIFMGSTQDINQ